MPNERVVERQRVYRQYKADVKERGKKFFPYAMLHDTIMSLVVVIVIIVLAAVWKWTIPGDHEGTESGWLGKLYDEPADPGTISFIPRPDWYFYFLFYLLRIFKWPESVILGTIGVPTLCALLLLALPFMDLRAERRPLHRPVAMVAAVLVILSMGVLTWKGATVEGVARLGRGRERADVGEGAGLRGQQGRDRGGDALRRERLPELPHLSRLRLEQPRRARPQRDRHERQDRRAVRQVRRQPGGLRQQRHAAVRARPHGGAFTDEQLAQIGEFLFSSKGPSGGG